MLILLSLMAGLAALWLHEQTELAYSEPHSDQTKFELYNKLKWRCFGIFLIFGLMHIFSK